MNAVITASYSAIGSYVQGGKAKPIPARSVNPNLGIWWRQSMQEWK